MPGLFALLAEEVPSYRQSTYKGETEKNTESVTSTDDESNDGDELTRPKGTTDDRNDHTRLPNGDVEPTFDEDDKEESTEDEAEHELDARKEMPATDQQKDTKSKKPSKGGLFHRISSKGSWLMNKTSGKNKASEANFDEDVSLLSTDQSSTFEPASPLRALAAEQQEAMDKEMDELISEALVGFDNEVIEKELDDQKSAVSLAEYVSSDIQKGAEGLLAAWVDRLDIFAPCGGCGIRYRHSDDNVSIELRSIQSRYSGQDKGNDDLVLGQDMSMEREIVLNDDDTLTILSNGEDDTIVTFDDESLASEYDDFNKAMMMLKRRAAHHRLSDAQLLQKIQTEQERRKSQGLTPTMIEI